MTDAKRKILIVEDELDIRESLKRLLLPYYSVYTASHGEEGLQVADLVQPDLIVLDIIMPGIDGISVCETLKGSEKTKDIPIIMLTATDDDERRAKCFLAGADDVVSKPFKIKEFLARLHTKLEKLHKQKFQDEILTFGNLVLDGRKLDATVQGQSVSLTVLEFKLLRYLAQNKERVLSREKILDAMWQKDVTERTIDNHIMSIRRKLQGADYALVSVYGAGYTFKKPDDNDKTK